HPIAFIVVAVAAVVCIGAIAGTAVAKKFARPLEDLSNRADTFAHGNFNVDFTIEEGPREVLALADSLNEITNSTRTAMAELRTEEMKQVQFVSDVSHEIRTPLTGIRGIAETLLEGDVPLEVEQRFLSSIISECDRLTRLANDLLTLQRIDSAKENFMLKRIDLREIVEAVDDMLEPLLESREISLSIAGEAPDVLGDRDKLVQVLINVIENASRFAESHVHVELSGVKGQSVITVSDNGPGFGDIDPARLFDRFYRADLSRQSATGGTGLGLAIVKSIVTAHDGTVEAINLPSGGACFIVGLPSVAPK
ncbi:MAG: HAMP domain-containing histidine kinase, partial [Actinobacteria bacterium]|nr:HAMP domain-containing histidine kinase [Actinomycetota bacterium]